MDDRAWIPTEPRQGGALDWFDLVDETHRVQMPVIGKRYPKTPKAQEAWLIDHLRNDLLYQGFFCAPLAHKGMALDFQVIHEEPAARDNWGWTVGTVPLAQLFLLPNENPAEELAQMKAFLTWVYERLQGQGENGRQGRLQWYRSGRRNGRGLEAAGFEDKAKRDALTQDIQAWREQPWFEAWYQANLKGLGRVRLGPHCWWPLHSLRAVPVR